MKLERLDHDDEPVFVGNPGLQFGLFPAQVTSPPRETESSGLRHVALVVDDLEAAKAHLDAHGVVYRPDGNTLELTTYKR